MKRSVQFLLMFVSVLMALMVGQGAKADMNFIPADQPLELINEHSLTLTSGIQAFDFTGDGKDIAVLDEDGIELISAEDLDRAKRLAVDKPWHIPLTNMVVSAVSGKILVSNQWLDYTTGVLDRVLNIDGVVQKGNPWAEPMAVSPDGKKGFFIVHSFFGDQYDQQALFDLTTGRLLYQESGGNKVFNAQFVSNDELLLVGRDGRVVLQMVSDGSKNEVLTDGVGASSIKNLSIEWSDDRQWIVFSGFDKEMNHKVKVYHYPDFELVFADDSQANVVFISPDRILYQTYFDTGVLCDCGRHNVIENVFRIVDVSSGMIVKNIKTRRNYDALLADPGEQELFAVTRDAIVKLRICGW